MFNMTHDFGSANIFDDSSSNISYLKLFCSVRIIIDLFIRVGFPFPMIHILKHYSTIMIEM
jgi:hypothetical protein